MRSMLLVPLLAVGLATACGRIGYAPISETGDGGNIGTGSGGIGSGGIASGSGGTGGASGSSAGGASGSTAGGASGSSAGGASGSSAGGSSAGGASGSSAGGSSAGGASGSSAGGSSAGGASGAAGGRGGAVGGAGGAMIGGGGVSGASCPTDTFGGHTYAFCVGPLSWADAQTDCLAKGMRLVRIDDSAENDWVVSMAFAGIGSVSSIYWSWIGATDVAVTGEWRWTDGALFWLGNMNGSAQGGLYNDWVAASPGNGTSSQCGILEHSAFWKDYPCSTLERYVCEQY
jgi:hypothetical protein